ncbi:MAG: methyltransferase domain-containing protein [Flavobacteriaceae bacterium]
MKEDIKKGFSKISHEYERLEKTSSLLTWMRMRVRNHFEKVATPKRRVLEINCGSGIDAVYFAKNGYQVHATDIATGMIGYVEQKIKSEKLESKLSCELLSFNELNNLKPKNFNHIFSNFGGLNCSSLEELKTVFNLFDNLLASNGTITLVIMPKICMWEFLRIFKGQKSAFRRLKKGGVIANIEGEKVFTYYHSIKEIKVLLAANFTNFKVENICFLAPSGNRVNFPEKHPKTFKFLSVFDTISNKIPFLRGFGDYYIISAQKK